VNFSSNFSAPFIRRPVATSLITIAIFLSGVVAFRFLPVAPLPRVDFPTIGVGAGLPGASPETMASAVATPLERQFSRIAGVTQMTSSSGLGSTSITLQFDLNRDINAAARDVQAAINAARSQLPADLPGQPTYRKVNPADAPILIFSLTSDNIPPAQIYDAADSVLAQKLAQVEGVGQVFTWGSARPAVRVETNPYQLNSYGISLETVRKSLQAANANLAKGALSDPKQTWAITDTDQLYKAYEYQPLIVAGHQGAPVRLRDVAEVVDSVEDTRNLGLSNGKPSQSASRRSSRPAHISKSQSCRCADPDIFVDLRQHPARADLRRRGFRPRAETRTGARCRPGFHLGQRPSGCARRDEPLPAQ